MSKTGRPKKPTALKILEGNPGKRRLARNERQFGGSSEGPPDWLLPEARSEWDRLAPELESLGLLPASSRHLFAAYCQSFARWKEAEIWMTEHGRTLVLRDRDGRVTGVREVPHSRIAQAEKQQMQRLSSEFGLTPSSAAGLAPARKQEKQNRFANLKIVK